MSSAMGVSVPERTREFAVMKTIGATPARIAWLVVAESFFIGGDLTPELVSVAVSVRRMVEIRRRHSPVRDRKEPFRVVV